jgi:hypothetical protein
VLSDAGLSRLHAVGADLLALGALLEAAHSYGILAHDVLANGLLAHLRGCGETLSTLHPRHRLHSRRSEALALHPRRGKAATAATATLDVQRAGLLAATAATAALDVEGASLLAAAAAAPLDDRSCTAASATTMFAGLRCRRHANGQRRDSGG